MLYIIDWLNHYVSTSVEICDLATEAQRNSVTHQLQQAALLAYLSLQLLPSYPKLYSIRSKLHFFLQPGLFQTEKSQKVPEESATVRHYKLLFKMKEDDASQVSEDTPMSGTLSPMAPSTRTLLQPCFIAEKLHILSNYEIFRFSHTLSSKKGFKTCTFVDAEGFKCEKQATMSNLTTHISSHLNHRPFVCNFGDCDKGFKLKSHRDQHVLTHKVQERTLKSISKATTAATVATTAARQIEDKVEKEKIIVCRSPSLQLREMASCIDQGTGLVGYDPQKRYACQFPRCNKRYSGSTNLKIHMRTHTGSRPFSCRHCDRAFAAKGNLKKHLGRIHKAAELPVELVTLKVIRKQQTKGKLGQKQAKSGSSIPARCEPQDSCPRASNPAPFMDVCTQPDSQSEYLIDKTTTGNAGGLGIAIANQQRLPLSQPTVEIIEDELLGWCDLKDMSNISAFLRTDSEIQKQTSEL